jgi:CPA2 family monovalent cation:H+ antiporter-2
MQELAPLIQDLTVILGVAGIVTLIFQRIHQPVVLGYLVAGIIIGPYTPPHTLVTDMPSIQILSELGVIFLMFSLGLDFSFHKLTRVGFSASVTGIFEVIVMSLLGFTIGKLLGWSYHDSIFLGAALAISSTTIIIKAIDELGLIKRRFAEFVFGILIVEDLLAILLLVILSTIVATQNILSLEILRAAGKLILVVGSWFIIGYFLIPTFLRSIKHFASDETLMVLSVSLCLFLASVAAHFHYSTALGAFIMGSILAETPIVHRIEKLIKPMRDIFAAIFFTSVGMLIDPKIILIHWPIVLLITVVTIIGKLITTGLGAFLSGQSLNTSLRAGFSMAQIGEFSFIIISLGLMLGVISNSLYPIIVAASGITTFTTPYLIKWSGKLTEVLDKKLSDRTKYMLGSYSNKLFRFFSSSNQQITVKKILLRLSVNGLVIAIIFTLVKKMFLPEMLLITTSNWVANTLCWLMALLLSSPFLWGMLFSYKFFSAKNNIHSAVHVVSFVYAVAIIEITLLSVFYFQTWFVLLLLILLATSFLALAFQQLEKTYHWFERQLVNNINRKSTRHAKYAELAPWDTHLVELNVTSHAPFAYKTLKHCQIRQAFDINIVAISRSNNIIIAPRGTELLLPEDKLIVLGNDEQIEQFRKRIETSEMISESDDTLENFRLHAMLLDNDNVLIGKSIRESNIREQLHAIIVGLERNGTHILNPDPNTVLANGDLLLMVLEEQYLNVAQELF